MTLLPFSSEGWQTFFEPLYRCYTVQHTHQYDPTLHNFIYFSSHQLTHTSNPGDPRFCLLFHSVQRMPALLQASSIEQTAAPLSNTHTTTIQHCAVQLIFPLTNSPTHPTQVTLDFGYPTHDKEEKKKDQPLDVSRVESAGVDWILLELEPLAYHSSRSTASNARERHW